LLLVLVVEGGDGQILVTVEIQQEVMVQTLAYLAQHHFQQYGLQVEVVVLLLVVLHMQVKVVAQVVEQMDTP
jgi:hypothetical protein